MDLRRVLEVRNSPIAWMTVSLDFIVINCVTLPYDLS